MNVWLENQEGRRCGEAMSALLTFFENPEILGSELDAWTNSCTGQNKKIMISIWQLLLFTGWFKVIDHKFPEVGHTYMDSDRDLRFNWVTGAQDIKGILCQ